MKKQQPTGNKQAQEQVGNYYVTTPIYYANGRPHLGSAYTTTLADTLVRYHRYLGKETFCLTGTDEHGDKVQQAAMEAGRSPKEFTDEVSEIFKNTWKELGLEYSRFIRTTDSDHRQVVQSILSKIHTQGDIYFGEYSGLYCVGCERFLTDKELIDGQCPDHKTTPQLVKEQNYFFRMSKYQQQLIDHIQQHADFIRPERYRNEVLALLREPLEDLCISRPKSRLTWGIELPFDNNYVTYVWFDALINYLSGVGYPDGEDFKRFWPNCEHLIGKDIVKPHGVFWPTMLLAAGIPLYKHLSVHGFWVTPIGKMSKSLGNVVNPLEIKRQYGMDAFRYFIFREMAFGLDGTFSAEAFETRYNADLANNLGNLVSRSLAMVHKYRAGKVPAAGAEDGLAAELRERAMRCVAEVDALMNRMELHRALEEIWGLIDCANVYIDRTKPWVLAKAESNKQSDTAAQGNARQALDTALVYQVEAIRIVAGLVAPFLPDSSNRILAMLGVAAAEITKFQRRSATASWSLPLSGNSIEKVESLFPRIENWGSSDGSHSDSKKEKGMSIENVGAASGGEKTVSTGNSIPAEAAQISYDDFAKVQLRVGQIMQAEKVEKSEKLVKLQVDLGEESYRQIVAGIAKHYSPESLVGRKIAVVANLKPAKLMGIQSEGMLLAASDVVGNLELLSVGPTLTPGSVIK